MLKWAGGAGEDVGAKGVVTEGVGAMGAAGVVELLPALDIVLELLGGRCKCPFKVTWLMLSKFSKPLLKLRWYPCFLTYKCSNLLICLALILSCLFFFILLIRCKQLLISFLVTMFLRQEYCLYPLCSYM